MSHASRLARMLALLLGISVLAPASAAARAFPDRVELPDGFLPEGIAIGPGPTAWFGSRDDGDIYGVDLRTGEGAEVSEGPGTPAIGLDLDRRHRLYVAGGPAGTGRVIDTDTGDVLADYGFTPAPTFVNDVIVADGTAWFTDSFRARLYTVPLGPGGELPAQQDVGTLPLTGDWVQGDGFGANGITPTPDGSALLVVHSTSGELHRVDPATGSTERVDLGGASLVNGDGMMLDGTTLYVVQNRLDRIAVFELDRAGRTGRVVETITSGDFDVPTTVAGFGPWLYLPNARFNSPQEPGTEFWVSRVDRR